MQTRTQVSSNENINDFPPTNYQNCNETSQSNEEGGHNNSINPTIEENYDNEKKQLKPQKNYKILTEFKITIIKNSNYKTLN